MNESINSVYAPETRPVPRAETYTAEELSEYRFKRVNYLIDTLLAPGLTVLAGAPKVGKSWLVLQLCMKLAQGEPFWGMKTGKCTVLYFALEDSLARLQRRILTVPSECSPDLHIAIRCRSLTDGFEDQLRTFIAEHPDTRLAVVDTFQKIRTETDRMSYANDYAEVGYLKKIADALNICILLVHHTRKMSDADALNEISGTNGIAGCADTLMVLKKEKRTDSTATLTCTGRDIDDRELELRLNRTNCLWEVIRDSAQDSVPQLMPDILKQLVRFMQKEEKFEGSNRLFAERFGAFVGKAVEMRGLKRQMNRWRYELEDRGVSFMSLRSENARNLLAVYSEKHDLKPDVS